MLVRFDCDHSLNVDRPIFKRNNLRFEQSTYFQARVRLPDFMRRQIDKERDRVDRDTIQTEALLPLPNPAYNPNVKPTTPKPEAKRSTDR